MEEDEVKEYISNPDIKKFTGPGRMHLQERRELADVIVTMLSITFEQSQQLIEMPEEWRKANGTHLQKEQEGGPRELRASQAHLDGANHGNHFQICDR